MFYYILIWSSQSILGPVISRKKKIIIIIIIPISGMETCRGGTEFYLNAGND